MFRSLLTTFVFILLSSNYGTSENILFYFPFGSYSHRISVWPLVETLTEKGHQITFFSSFFPKTPNPKVTEIVPELLRRMMSDMSINMLEYRIETEGKMDEGSWSTMPELGFETCELALMSEEMKEMLAISKFDLIVIDVLFNECGLGLVHLFKAKFVYYATGVLPMWFPDMFGHVPETSWIPDIEYHLPQQMTFSEKVWNTLRPLYWQYWVRHQIYFPRLEALLRKELQIPYMPDLKEIEKNTSLVFINNHYSVEYARTLPPLYILVGGLHLSNAESKKTTLPKEMQKFVDESGEGGFVFISFGSFAQASDFPPELLQVFYRVLKSFQSTRFIWKWNMDRPKEMPENVMTVKWAPQAELLSHKSIRGFITHGGVLSIQEATYYGVPVIVFPIFADQDYNGEIINRTDCGIKLEIVGLKDVDLQNGIRRLLNDHSLKLKMLEKSTGFRDRPKKPLDTAVFWMEYVLRHKDTSFLKPLGIHQTWYQIRLLDVWIFLFSIVLGLCLSFLWLVCLCFKQKSVRNAPVKKIKKK